MHVNLCPNHFPDSDKSYEVEITVTGGGKRPDLSKWTCDATAEYTYPDGTKSHWKIPKWTASSPDKAKFTLVTSKHAVKGPHGGSGTLTVTGTDGTNSDPIPVPCSTS